MSTGRLLQLTSVIIDIVYRVKAVPPPGGEAGVRDCNIYAGGGFNLLTAAQRCGLDVAYGGVHGSGLFSDMAREALRRIGAPILQPQLKVADQGSCVVLIDDNAERTFITKSGADDNLNAECLCDVPTKDFDWLTLSGYTLVYSNAHVLGDWVVARAGNSNLVFDPSPAVPGIDKDLLNSVLRSSLWISTNSEEAKLMTGETTPENSTANLFRHVKSDSGGVVVRDGANGCWVMTSGEPACHVPGYAVNSIDTNGAGDTHIGAFLAGLTMGKSAYEAADFANAAAALSTTWQGPAAAPGVAEINSLIKGEDYSLTIDVPGSGPHETRMDKSDKSRSMEQGDLR